ncbi:MAG: AAC(3) family N-acetyltransferase, partial [Rhodospirillaceae bacterium]
SSYSFSYAKSRRYDPHRTRPETGILPQTAMSHPAFRRTLKPINNYLVAGPRAPEIVALPCSTSWGDDGVMGWVERMNARICVFGTPWHVAASFYHRGEAKQAVPYRFYKRFPGVLMHDTEEVGPCEETLFVCSLSEPPEFDWSRIRPRMPEFGDIVAGRNRKIFAESAQASTVIAACESILTEDPLGLLTNAETVRYWINDGRRAKEIVALPPGENSRLND